MEFYIGLEVVCIDDSNQEIAPVLKKDETYTINELFLVSSGKLSLNVNGIILPNNNYKRVGHKASRFKPLDELCNISELTEILEQPAFQ